MNPSSSSSSSNKRCSTGSTAPTVDHPQERHPKKLFADLSETTTTGTSPSLSPLSLSTCLDHPNPLTTTPALSSAPALLIPLARQWSSKGSASLPQRRPPSRTVSDRSPSKSFSQSSIRNGDRLKKMRDYMNQMSQWWNDYMADEVMGEEEEEKAIEDNTPMATTDDSVTGFEEAVGVEKAGKCFIINFKCPCNKVCQILFSERSCY